MNNNDLKDILRKLNSSLPMCGICLENSKEYIDCEETMCSLPNGIEVTFQQGFIEITKNNKDLSQTNIPRNFCSNCGKELLNAYSFIKRVEHANYIWNKLTKFTKERLATNRCSEQEQTKNKQVFPIAENDVLEVSNIEEEYQNYEEFYMLDEFVEDEEHETKIEIMSTIVQNEVELESGTTMFICQECGLFCQSEEDLERHKDKVHEKESEESTDGDNHQQIENDDSYPSSPTNENEETNNYICDVCSCTFETKRNYNIHKIRAHDNNQTYQEEEMAHEIQNAIHSQSQAKEPPETAKTKISSMQTDLKNNHKYNNHITGHYACHICDKVCHRPFTLKKHIQHMHIKERKRHQCEDCGLFFPFPSNLKEHRRKHNSTNLFKCPNCDRTFLRKQQLEIHMRYHLNHFPYKCDKCDKCYATKSNLSDHVKAKHTKTSYDCDRCKQTFMSPTGLKKHKYTHDGYPYNCPICSMGQTSRSAMKQHLMGVHKDAVTEEEFNIMFPIINPKTGYRRPKDLPVN